MLLSTQLSWCDPCEWCDHCEGCDVSTLAGQGNNVFAVKGAVLEVIKERLLDSIAHFKDSFVLVVGDIMLDHYVWGAVERISPEAPVPVVSVTDESMHLGGAANVLNNILTLGARCEIVGLVGADIYGDQVVGLMEKRGMDTGGITVDPQRQTIKKTRVIAHNQHVVRFDREDSSPVSDDIEQKLIESAVARLASCSSLIISDYSKGVVTKKMVAVLVAKATELGKPILVDPKVSHFGFYKGVSLATPNCLEAGNAAGMTIRPGDDKAVLEAGVRLKTELESEGLLITRGEEGMTLFHGAGVVHIPTKAKKVYDVTGAGDTVISVLGIALGVGASLLESAILANYAAGLVVEVVGTATVIPHELKKIVSEEFDSTVDYAIVGDA